MSAEIQGLPVDGYRATQSTTSIAIVNTNKQIEETVLRMLDVMRQSGTIDQRWLAIGRTKIEEGFMAINRAVFKPGRVTLPSDKGEV